MLHLSPARGSCFALHHVATPPPADDPPRAVEPRHDGSWRPRHVWLPVRPTFKEALFLVFVVVIAWRLMRLPGSVLDAGYSLWIVLGMVALVVGGIVARSLARVPELPEVTRAEIETQARRDLESGEVEELEFDVRDAIAVVDPDIDETTYLLDVGGGNVLCLEAHQLPGYGIDHQLRPITPLPRRSLSLTRAVPSRQETGAGERGCSGGGGRVKRLHEKIVPDVGSGMLGSPSIEDSNPIMAWMRGMGALREAIGTAA